MKERHVHPVKERHVHPAAPSTGAHTSAPSPSGCQACPLSAGSVAREPSLGGAINQHVMGMWTAGMSRNRDFKSPNCSIYNS